MHPLPWYIAGPLIGLVVPALLLIGNKPFGVSSNFRHLCGAIAPCGLEFFRHDWRRLGAWNLAFLGGVFVGAAIAYAIFFVLLELVAFGSVIALRGDRDGHGGDDCVDLFL